MLAIPAITTDDSTIEAALKYASAGWYVLPVRRGTKNPGSVVGRGWQQKSTRERQQIAAWLAGSDHGIALHCGRSGAVVFDVDYPDAVPGVLRNHLDCAPYQSTRADSPGRGHYVFAMPPGRQIGCRAGRLGGEWGEVRGHNGVIMAAPSFHPEGGLYRWERFVGSPIPILPEEIAELLGDALPAAGAASDVVVATFVADHQRADREQYLDGWINALKKHLRSEGSRHDGAVSIVTGALKEARAGYFSAQAALDALRPLFLTAVTRRPRDGELQRKAEEAQVEWHDLVAWAVAQANAADLPDVQARLAEVFRDDTARPPRIVVHRTNAEQSDALEKAHAVFLDWLGSGYDLDALDAVLAAAAAHFMDGDPLWLLLVSGSGNAKTETTQSLSLVPGVCVVSTIASQGALLSATSRKERRRAQVAGFCVLSVPAGSSSSRISPRSSL